MALRRHVLFSEFDLNLTLTYVEIVYEGKSQSVGLKIFAETAWILTGRKGLSAVHSGPK